ncbi:hypothetical protein BDV33DRAFT_206107 [Aspergillus novoparasiticus]|uniref:Uncharacterized protein n=1 Tax=Aspergillus novoparasiticus TaxID=986946 RepID=A0A5N6EKA7_9EURO|nr:hypothetical protein BDV33DRAFT_206107 [Aspergillus novoparasiticus]
MTTFSQFFGNTTITECERAMLTDLLSEQSLDVTDVFFTPTTDAQPEQQRFLDLTPSESLGEQFNWSINDFESVLWKALFDIELGDNDCSIETVPSNDAFRFIYDLGPAAWRI